MSIIEAEVKAMFTIELARSKALQALAQLAGQEVAEAAWQLGYLCGKTEGLQKALELAARSVA